MRRAGPSSPAGTVWQTVAVWLTAVPSSSTEVGRLAVRISANVHFMIITRPPAAGAGAARAGRAASGEKARRRRCTPGEARLRVDDRRRRGEVPVES
jgi:hypothetical protein